MAKKDQKVAEEQKATDEQLDKERSVSAGDDEGGAVSQSSQDDTSTQDDTSSDTSSQDEFREAQKREAATQGLTDERAVPESRNPVWSRSEANESEVTKRQREAGLIDPEPMDQAAYDRAEQGAESNAGEGAHEAIKQADYIEVTNEESPYFKQRGSVVRLVFSNEDEAQRSGQPAQRFIQPVEFEARSIGGPVGDQTMMLRPDEVRKITEREWIGSA
jgi:hypothetical protein